MYSEVYKLKGIYKMSGKNKTNDLIEFLKEIDISHWKQSYTDHNDYKLYQCKSTGARFLGISRQKKITDDTGVSFEGQDAKVNQSTASKIKPSLEMDAEAWISLSFEHGFMSPLFPTTSTIHLAHFLEHIVTNRIFKISHTTAHTIAEETQYYTNISNKDKSQISTYLKSFLSQTKYTYPAINEMINGGNLIQVMQIEHGQVKCENFLASTNQIISLEMILQFAAIPDHPVCGYNGFPIKSDYQDAVKNHLPTLKTFFRYGYRSKDTNVVVGGPYKASELKAEIAAVSKILTSEKNKIKQTENNKQDTETIVTKNEIVWETMNKIPFIQDQFHSLLVMKSFNHTSEILIRWVIEPFYARQLSTAPLRYVLAVLDNRAKGSLCYVLMSKGYIVDYEVRADNCAFVTLITLRLLLTFRGLENWEIVLKIIFQYFDWFKNETPSKIFYQQQMKLQNIYFHHIMDRDNVQYGNHLAAWLSYIKNPFLKITKPEKWAKTYSEQPEPDIMNAVNCMHEYDEDLIKELQQLMCIEECSVTLIYSNHFIASESLSKIQKSKKPISIDKYPCEFVAMDWKSLKKHLLSTTTNMSKVESFSIPRIPDKMMKQLTLMDCPVTQGNEWYGLKHAINNEERTLENRNVKTTTIRLGDYCHDPGSTPFATYNVHMVCNEDWIKTRNGHVFLSLWSKLLNDSQQKKVCTFNTCGLCYIFPSCYEGSTIPLIATTLNVSLKEDFGISLFLDGPPTDLHKFVCKVLNSVFAIDDYLSEISWEVLESQFLLEKSSEVMENYTYAQAIANYMLKTNTYLYNPTKSVRRVELSLQEFRQMVSKFLNSCSLELRIKGCVLESQQQHVTEFLVNLSRLQKKPRNMSSKVKTSRQIPENKKMLVAIESKNPNLSFSCMINYYQFKAKDVSGVKQLEYELRNVLLSWLNTHSIGYKFGLEFFEPEEGSENCFLRLFYCSSCSVEPSNPIEASFVILDKKEEESVFKCKQILSRASNKKNKDLPKLTGKLSVRVFSTVPEFQVYQSGTKNDETGITYLNVRKLDEAVTAKPSDSWVISKSYIVVDSIESEIAKWL